MDKIWDRKSFEVGGHWPLSRGWKNRMTKQSWQKSNSKKEIGLQTGTFFYCGMNLLELKAFMFIYIKCVLFIFFQDKGKTTLVKLLANKTVDQHRKSIIREEITLAAKKDFPVSCCHNWFLLTIFSTSVAHAICGILSNVHDSVHSFKWLFNMHCL